MGKAIECTHPLIIHSDCLGGSVESTLSPGPYFPRARAHARARDLAAGGGDFGGTAGSQAEAIYRERYGKSEIEIADGDRPRWGYCSAAG
jgi:hypothetical protein